jgi:hypothetical protein
MRRSAIRMVLVGSGLLHSAFSISLWADGGTVQLSRQQGEYRITVFTAPAPLRAGPADVSVLVQHAGTGQAIPTARVTIRATPRGRQGDTIVCAATKEAATNKLFRAAVFELPEAGWWELDVVVEGEGREPTEVRFEVEAAERMPQWVTLWPWLAWPAAAIGLFGLHQLLARRGATMRRS